MMPVPRSSDYAGSSLGGPPTNAQTIISAGQLAANRLRAAQQKQTAEAAKPAYTPPALPQLVPPLGAAAGVVAGSGYQSQTGGDGFGTIKIDNQPKQQPPSGGVSSGGTTTTQPKQQPSTNPSQPKQEPSSGNVLGGGGIGHA